MRTVPEREGLHVSEREREGRCESVCAEFHILTRHCNSRAQFSLTPSHLFVLVFIREFQTNDHKHDGMRNKKGRKTNKGTKKKKGFHLSNFSLSNDSPGNISIDQNHPT